MTITENTPHRFQRGLLPLDPVKHARFKTAINYGFALPSAIYPIDKTEGITDWGMDGNGPDPTLTVNGGNPVGDCGPSAVPSHADMLTAVLTGENLVANTMTSDQVVDLYFQYTGGQDTGVDLGDWLLWLYQQGTIDGFLKLDLSQMDAALFTFNVVIVGVNLNPQADAQFGTMWDVGPGDEPDPDDGHAILYLKAQTPSGPFAWCTWGATQPSTLAWKQACPQQAFAVLTKEEAEGVGFPFAALDADLKALGGTAVPLTPPSPGPAPAPAPPTPGPGPAPLPPVPNPDGLIAELESLAHEAIDAIISLVERAGGSIPEWTRERTHKGFGETMHAIEALADGEWHEAEN